MVTPAWLSFAQDASLPVVALAAFLLAVTQAIKVWPTLREMQIKGDASMRGQLMERIQTLEDRVKELEILVNQKDAEHAMKEQFLRHELANEQGALDAALSMLRINPDRVKEIIDEVANMREVGRQRIAMEKGAAAGAAVVATGAGIFASNEES